MDRVQIPTPEETRARLDEEIQTGDKQLLLLQGRKNKLARQQLRARLTRLIFRRNQIEQEISPD